MDDRKIKTLDDFDPMEWCSREAAELGPFGKDDGPCEVTCYRQVEKWKSRKAALKFFECGAECCGGSEHMRYARIAERLRAGAAKADDGED